jgi:ectoine hydroxylase-related dioxygenase (phytanoyl-CoA dioxygenase family)
MMEIQQSDIDHWYQHGYVIIRNFLTRPELDAALENISYYLPNREEYYRDKARYAGLVGDSTRVLPGWVRNEFPYVGEALNRVAMHPFLVSFVEKLVGHSSIRMSHGAIVGKYAGKADYDQELHPDYTNNTLVFPPAGVAAIDIPMIAYLTDVTVDLGPTYVVTKQLTEHLVSDGRRFHSRAEYPELYAAEIPALMPAGSVLIYSMRTFHRGSRMMAAEGARFSQFIGYHTAGHDWLGSSSFQGSGDNPSMDGLLVRSTPRERELLGFPAAHDRYWTAETLAGVRARYPDMDMTPYGD